MLLCECVCSRMCVCVCVCGAVILRYCEIEGCVRSQVKPLDLFQAETLPPVPILYFCSKVLDSNCVTNVVDQIELFILCLSA